MKVTSYNRLDWENDFTILIGSMEEKREVIKYLDDKGYPVYNLDLMDMGCDYYEYPYMVWDTDDGIFTSAAATVGVGYKYITFEAFKNKGFIGYDKFKFKFIKNEI